MKKKTTRPGRKCSGPNEVRVLTSGAVRLSEDLSNDTGYVFVVTVDNERLLLTTAKPGAPGAKRLTYSNPKARSPIVRLGDAFRFLNLDPRKIAGVYAAQKTPAGMVVLDFSKRKAA